MAAKDPVLTPELLKIIKIFGIASILMVLGLSFFNSRRANNTGEDLTFRMSDAARIYFLNMKAINYNREIRSDAGMTLFRHEDLSVKNDEAGIQLVLILNPPKDEAYLYLEPRNFDWPIQIKSGGETFIFKNGNKSDHLSAINQLKALIENGKMIFLVQNEREIPLWEEESEKDALKQVFEDYARLVE
ncbi:MAG TPA: hypothetical protein DEQ87_03500 [Algoriphagus sp.]|uniref:hypothetical protein n=1 Tax=Algoriphagus sp. TaxID=1872435 RepID=UPI000ED33E9E|nr:hypothetical protein [Algoriphagus sp.]HCD86693.1 hypothetical protein [Algoriphagus sp.]